MQKKDFEYKNEIDFKNELLSFRSLLPTMVKRGVSPKLYFQIITSVLDEERLRPVWENIQSVFPDAPWFGYSTCGNIVDGDIAPEVTVAVTIFEKESTQFEVMHFDLERNTVQEVCSEIVHHANSYSWVKAVEIYRTIPNECTPLLCEGVRDLRPNVQVFGGIVCSTDLTSKRSCVFSSVGGYSKHGLVLLLMGGNDFHVESFKVSGWKPIGRNFKVTRSEGNILYELNGMPAFEVYRKYLNIGNDNHFFENALNFPILYEHNETIIVRSPAACNPDGSIVLSSEVEVGSMVRLSYGEPQTIVDEVRQECDRIKSFNPDTLHIFSCVARKAFWEGYEPTYEILPFKNIASSTGFFSHGEFLREKGHLNQHNVTLVIAALREGCGKGLQASAYSRRRAVSPKKIPLAARMANFIRETTAELEEMDRKLNEIKYPDSAC